MFIDPNLNDIKIAKELNADCVELHTGKISNLIKSKKNYIYEYKKIDLSSFEARKILQEELNQTNEILKIESLKLKDYILKRYTMEDLF